LPAFIAVADLPVYKRNRASAPMVSFNDGHFHGELGAMEERDERHSDDKPDQRDWSQRQREFGVGDIDDALCRWR
jgi:hypothetical protein